MGYDTIHETVIQDIVDIMKEGIKTGDEVFGRSSGAAYSSSLTKATKGLIMEFPVLVSKANHIESAGIVAKAYEAKFVTLLHLAFAACGITNDKNGMEFLKGFHTNLDYGKISVDDFIDVMDGIVEESSSITADSYAKYRAVTEEMRRVAYYFDDDINESSLNSYKVFNNYGSLKVVKEDNRFQNPVDAGVQAMTDAEKEAERERERKTKLRLDNRKTQNDTLRTQASLKNDKEKLRLDNRKTQNDTLKTKSSIERDKLRNDLDVRKDTRDTERLGLDKNKDSRDTERLGLDKNRDRRDTERHHMDLLKTQQDMITNYIVPSDLKKANELVPTMMVVNFVIQDPDNAEAHIAQQMVIGVKAKLYEVEPTDVINKIITKHVDNNILLKLVKVSTREISFVKDFLLAIDDAKLDALSRSKRGSANKLFKVLERRALGGKVRKVLRQKDYYKAITSLVISQEEAEELLKNNIDVSNPKIIRPIMEKLNLISFAIIDESAESVKFLFDTGDDVYETIPLSRLEKEQKDGMSKKVINLMAKMNR